MNKGNSSSSGHGQLQAASSSKSNHPSCSWCLFQLAPSEISHAKIFACVHMFCHSCSKVVKKDKECPMPYCAASRTPKKTLLGKVEDDGNSANSSSNNKVEKSSTRLQDSKSHNVEDCPICLSEITGEPAKPSVCEHEFCKDCLEVALKRDNKCPVCRVPVGMITGDQPDGTMTNRLLPQQSLEGYEGASTIMVTYRIPDGIQTASHPKPGHKFWGTTRYAYLPDTREGQEVLALLRRAFDQRLIFTVGTSATTGYSDVVVWNDVHHKTSIDGGPQRFGYPDMGYLIRVKEELKEKGIF